MKEYLNCPRQKKKKHIAALFYIVLQIFLVLVLIKDNWTTMLMFLHADSGKVHLSLRKNKSEKGK